MGPRSSLRILTPRGAVDAARPAKGLRRSIDWGSIAPLRIRARMVAEGVYAGAHRSARKGAGVEFGGHRAYVAGDDLRHLDVRSLLRHDHLLVRQFETETDRALRLVVDASASMGYRGSRAPGAKLAFAALIAVGARSRRDQERRSDRHDLHRRLEGRARRRGARRARGLRARGRRARESVGRGRGARRVDPRQRDRADRALGASRLGGRDPQRPHRSSAGGRGSDRRDRDARLRGHRRAGARSGRERLPVQGDGAAQVARGRLRSSRRTRPRAIATSKRSTRRRTAGDGRSSAAARNSSR